MRTKAPVTESSVVAKAKEERTERAPRAPRPEVKEEASAEA
jgi:small subunit ribosomal protein S6